MLESLVSTLLNRFLGAYVSNLNYNQLQIGIWSGEVVLRDLKLKREALDKLNLPVDVLEGYLGELTLNIPWSNLKGKPVMVNIKDIYVLAVPRNEAAMTVEEMEERKYQAKQRKLANSELVNTSHKTQNTSDEVKNDTFVNQLVTKIMNNLQFSISNIHVRYEDDVSVPNQRFAAGITLSELSAITTDENWIPKTIGDAINVVHKLATLESLSIYWNTDTDTLAFLEKEELKKAFQRLIATKTYIPKDHQYILKPVSGTGRIKLNKSFGNKVPKVDATLLFDELAFAIDNEQYNDAILMIDLFHSYLKKQKYYNLHPAADKTPKNHPREYFQFAAKAVLSEIHERNARWSWGRLKQRRDDRLEYIEYYVAEHLGNSPHTSEEITRKLDQLERKLTYEDIRFYRSLAKNKIKRMKAVMEAEEKQRKKTEMEAAKSSTTTQGWISSWWYGQTATNSNNEDTDGNNNNDPLVITEEQKQEFYDAIEYNEDKAAIAESIEIPKDTMLLQLRTSLNKGSFTINQRKNTLSDYKNTTTSELVSLVFDSVMLGSVLYLESWKASAVLGDLRLYDGVTKGTRYHQLVGVNRNISPSPSSTSPPSPLSTEKIESIQPKESIQHSSLLALKNPFFSVEYEYRPLDKRADNAIALKMRNIDIVYNPLIFNEIITFFKPPESSIESINALVVAAGDTFEDIKKQTRSTLTFALEQHATFDLHVDMDAPIIMIPESCTNEVSRGIVIDAGHINIESQLVPPDVVEKFIGKRQQQSIPHNQREDTELRSLMYDRFSMKLTQTKILIGDSVDTCLRQIHQPTQELNYLHFVDRIDMGFLLELSILDYASSELPKFKMSGHLPLLNVNFSDTKYRAIMQLPQLIAASGLFGNNDMDDNDNINLKHRNSNVNDLYTRNNMKQNDLMNVQLWKLEDDDLFFDSESEFDGDDDHHLYDTLSDTSHQTSSSAATPLSTNKQQQKTKNKKNQIRFDQKLFTLDFQVDKVTASISQHIQLSSNRSKELNSKNEALPTETLLCTLSLDGLALGYTLRPYDMSLNLTLQSLDMIDQMKDGTEFKYLVTSNHEVLQVQSYSEADNSSDHSKELVQLYYIQVDTNHPEYEKSYNKIDRTVKLTFSTLNFVVTCSSVLTLYNFAMSTFIDPEQKIVSPSSRRASTTIKHLSASEIIPLPPPSSLAQQEKQQSIQIELFLDSVNLILNNDGTRIGTGELSHGDLLIFVLGDKIDVRAKFANFTLTDDITNANNLNSKRAFLGNQMLTIQGEELIDLKYETFPKDFTNKEQRYFYDIEYPGYDQSLYLRMGSAQFTFMEEPICELLIFLSKFSAMKAFYDKARQAALETAQQQRMLKTHVDIVIRSPIVSFPDRIHQNGDFDEMKPLIDIVTAHLGEIWISNSYIEMKDRSIINSMKAGIRAMHLTSKYHDITPPTVIEPKHQVKVQTLPIVDDIDLTFDITIPFINDDQLNKPEQQQQQPAIDIFCELSRVSMHLTERQYTFLLDSVQMVSRIISTVQQDDLSIAVVDSSKNQQSSHEISTTQSSTTNNSEGNRNDNQINDASQFKMSMKMPSIEFEIYSEEDNSQLPASLSKFALNDSSLYINTHNDGSIDIKLQIRTLTMDDTRTDIQSKFRKIVPTTQQGYQITMQCDLNPPSLSTSGLLSRYGILLLTVNEPKVIVSLDHIFMVYKFFTAAINNHNQQLINNGNNNDSDMNQQRNSPMASYSSEPSTTSFIKGKSEQEEGSSLELSYRLNITNVEFILLANPDAIDTEAVVLSADTIMISQQSVMALVVKQMGMFLCRMNSRSTSTLRFIQPFDISISMNNNRISDFSDDVELVKELEMDVDALILRLSYRDAMLVTEIFNKAFDLYQKINENSSFIQSQENENRTDYTQSLINASKTTTAKNNLNQNLATRRIKESLRASFQGMQVILIEEIHEFPMVDMTLKPFNVEVLDWSKSFSANVAFSAYINYFNIKNSHWEPLIEPWQFKLNLSKKENAEEPFKVNLTSNADLNINVTHTFLESAMSNIAMFDKQKNSIYSGERGHESPYKIRNRTGYPIHIWNNKSSPNKASGDVTICKIEDGKDLPWWFEDWRKRREMTESVSNVLNVQLEGALWETIRGVHVDTEGEHIYGLRPLVRNVQHHLVFDVKLADNVKIVTIRSALVIENRTLLPIDVTILDSRGYSDGTFTKIAPGDDYSLPIEKAYHNRFCIRPDAGFGYKWTSHAIHWSDFVKNDDYKTTIDCVSEQQSDMPPFIFQMYSRQDKNNPLFGRYCFMSIRLSAPVEIENLLPYDFNFRIIDKTARQDYNSYLRRGGTIPLHVVENKHLLLLNIHLAGSDYKPSDFAIISTRGSDDLDIDDTLMLKDKYNNPLHLRLNIIEIPDSGGSFRYSIYSPYIIINKTGSPITLKPKLAWQNSMFSSQTSISVCRPSNKPEPFMYSYPKHDNKNRSLIQITGSEYSQPLSFEAVRSVFDVAMPTPSQTEEFHIGINVQEGIGKYKLTKMVTFTPRFILSNHMNVSVRYREPESRADQEVAPNSRKPLYRIRKSQEKQLCVKLPGIDNVWSAPFNIQDIGKIHVRLNSADGSTTMLLRVDTILEDATIYIVLSKESDSEWPYLFVNRTNEDMSFYQEHPMNSINDDYNSSSYSRMTKVKKYLLPAHSSIPYSWDMPAVKDRRIILNVNGRERSINVQEIGNQLPFRHMTRSGYQTITSIDIKTKHGIQQIVELYPYKQDNSLFRPLSPSSSSIRSNDSSSSLVTSARDGFETIDVKTITYAVVQIKLSHIGISVINKRLQELAYITFRGMEIKLTDSNMYQSLRWNIKWLQIDNQLYSTMFPILLYPTNMTKEPGQEILPTFQLALDRVKDDSHGVLYFKYFTVLLQELSLEMDEDFVYEVIDFAHFEVAGWNTISDDRVWEYSTEIPDAKPQEDISRLYFEILSIQPIRFELSFLKGSQGNSLNKSNQKNTPITFFVNILTMAIGNINNAPVRFNALAVENLMANQSDLANRIYIHYSDQFFNQIHKMIGSADFLGNPVGLFSNLSSGVAELFYEPYQGFIMSDRPQDLGMGIARGFSGFVRKSVFGVTDSFTKFTGSIGKGLSAATMDREYQDRRRMNMARNKPRHALVGVAQGANYFANSLASGVTGLVTQPMEGASKEGFGGFFAGVGKGLVGAVTKPVVGVFDLASNVTEGIRNTTTVSDTNDIERIRFPRFIGESGVLKPYSIREAQGQNWLKDVNGGKYTEDNYIAHCHLQQNDRVAMLTSNRLMLLRTQQLNVEWQEPFTDIQTIKCEPTGIAIYLRSMSWEPFLIIPDKSTREWFFKKIEETVVQYNVARSQYNKEKF